MPRKLPATYPSLITVLAITGCGGGAGGSNPAPQQNLQSARTPSQPMTIPPTMLSATDGSGNAYTIDYSSTPGGMAVFNGQNASTSMIALTVSENGAVIATEDSTAYYLTNPYSPLGLSGTTSGAAWTAITTGSSLVPTMLTVGDSGSLYTFTYMDGMGNTIGSLTETYTVAADSPDALFLNIDAAGSINGVQETETLTYAVASDGTVQGLVQARITFNGTTLTFH
jgi:hypothetical protein